MPLLKTSSISKIALFLFAAMFSLSSVAVDFSRTQRLASQGNSFAQFSLGYGYHYGEGVDQDSVKAIEWYTKAADQGFAAAKYNLGVMYGKGEGIQIDVRMYNYR